MARSPDDLPEGTDSIIDDDLGMGVDDGDIGAPLETTGSAGFDITDSADQTLADDGPIAGGAAFGAIPGATGSDSESGAGGAGGEGLKDKAAETAASFKAQAAEKARAYAEQGKEKATGALDNLARMVSEAADSVDQQVGPQYGAYARQAADMVSNFSSTLQSKDVDALVADASDLVRKSPAVAIGAAAALGFVLVRLVKSGVETASATTSGRPETTPAGDA